MAATVPRPVLGLTLDRGFPGGAGSRAQRWVGRRDVGRKVLFYVFSVVG